MLYAYNTAPQVLAQGASLAFANAGARRGCCERLEGGSVRLCRPGTYRVSVTASASVQAATAGDVGIQAVLGGQAVPGAVSTGYSAANGEDAPLSLAFLVMVGGCPVVSPVPATLAVQATQAQEVSACSVTVERVA